DDLIKEFERLTGNFRRGGVSEDAADLSPRRTAEPDRRRPVARVVLGVGRRRASRRAPPETVATHPTRATPRGTRAIPGRACVPRLRSTAAYARGPRLGGARAGALVRRVPTATPTHPAAGHPRSEYP